MKINIAATDKLTAAIAAVEGPRVSARTIDAEDIQYAVSSTIEKLLAKLLSKKDWRGLKFAVDLHAQIFPAAYRGSPESTQFIVERGANAWFVTSICRGSTNGPQGKIIPLNLSDKATELVAHAADSKHWGV